MRFVVVVCMVHAGMLVLGALITRIGAFFAWKLNAQQLLYHSTECDVIFVAH